MRKFIKSIRKSLADALRENEYIINWLERYPRTFKFLGRRFSRSQPYGLSFTIWLALGFVVLLWFISWGGDIVGDTPLVAVDIRIMNLLVAIRDMQFAKVFLFFTYLANWQIIVSLGIVFIVWLWLTGERYRTVLLVMTVFTAELAYTFIKFIVQRARPDAGFALIQQGGFSFPSGHATVAMALYGLVGYYLYSRYKQRWVKLLVLLVSFAVILLIGFSRMYLGVHWTSDVFSGWALGLIILIVLISAFDYRKLPKYDSVGTKSQRFSLIATLVVLEVIFIALFYALHPLKPVIATVPQIQPENITAENLTSIIAGPHFPKYSETISGQKMEPVSIIAVGTDAQIKQAFRAADWYLADEPKVQTWDELAKAAWFNLPYPTAPVTPAFLAAVPNQLAFEKATDSNSVRQRHHTRFWQTDFIIDHAPVWVATASFDDGMRYLVTHKIRPEIDLERDYIIEQLERTQLVTLVDDIKLVQPQMGKNQSQDVFFTDGHAYIIWFK